MAERNRGGNTHTNTDVNELSVEDKIAEVMRIIDTLDYPQLLCLRDLIDEEYRQKSEAVKVRVIAEAQEKFDQMGLTFEDVAAMQTKRKRVTRTPAAPKYRSPDGEKTWSGRGAMPKWIRELEEAGHSRDEYLIKAK